MQTSAHVGEAAEESVTFAEENAATRCDAVQDTSFIFMRHKNSDEYASKIFHHRFTLARKFALYLREKNYFFPHVYHVFIDPSFMITKKCRQ